MNSTLFTSALQAVGIPLQPCHVADAIGAIIGQIKNEMANMQVCANRDPDIFHLIPDIAYDLPEGIRHAGWLPVCSDCLWSRTQIVLCPITWYC